MRFSTVLLLAAQCTSILALPLQARNREAHAVGLGKQAGVKAPGAKAAKPNATAPAVEGEGNEIEIAGTFGKAVALGGGDVKTDVVFTKGALGSFEVEFQDKNANTLTVTENKKPAGAAPAGFSFLDTSSYKIALAKGANGLTLQKVDFIFDPALAPLKDVDISKAQFGKLCTETKSFVISEALGELEFEAEENEITLTVDNMVGEWGVFIPSAAAAPPTEGATGEGAKEEEVEVQGAFDKAIATPAGNLKTDILFPPSAAGLLEVEVKAAAATAVTVIQNKTPVAPPKGFLFVDPVTFKIATASKTGAADVVKVDYIFTPAVLSAVDASKGVIAKLDDATKQFITDPAKLDAEFEFEAEENEWTLTVKDLNGEWAILIPETAVLKSATVLSI